MLKKLIAILSVAFVLLASEHAAAIETISVVLTSKAFQYPPS